MQCSPEHSQWVAMFEVCDKDIGLLSDTDLRTLVVRLCEKEVKDAGFSTAVVTAGGDQKAKDGGLDVRVDLPGRFPKNGFIAKPLTGFQVKQEKSGFAQKKILAEMRPRGVARLRAVDLAYSSKFGTRSRSILATNFRWLWLNGFVRGVLIAAFRLLGKDVFWSEGWLGGSTSAS